MPSASMVASGCCPLGGSAGQQHRPAPFSRPGPRVPVAPAIKHCVLEPAIERGIQLHLRGAKEPEAKHDRAACLRQRSGMSALVVRRWSAWCPLPACSSAAHHVVLLRIVCKLLALRHAGVEGAGAVPGRIAGRREGQLGGGSGRAWLQVCQSLDEGRHGSSMHTGPRL